MGASNWLVLTEFLFKFVMLGNRLPLEVQYFILISVYFISVKVYIKSSDAALKVSLEIVPSLLLLCTTSKKFMIICEFNIFPISTWMLVNIHTFT